jgi:hypothetical protein
VPGPEPVQEGLPRTQRAAQAVGHRDQPSLAHLLDGEVDAVVTREPVLRTSAGLRSHAHPSI